MFVHHRFQVSEKTEDTIRSMIANFGYGGFGELVFYRTYSREKKGGGQENWADCVLRVVNGTFSIRKDLYLKNHISWDEDYWQNYAFRFAKAMFKMWWLPPGRGLWAMGTDFIYERGSMALFNCGMTHITDDIANDISWLMDALMLGVGVGFEPHRNDDLELHESQGSFDFEIPDSREGWCESVRLLINSYRYSFCKKPKFIYDKVRPAGLLIKGFGGISSGPGPLKWFHEKIDEFCHYYLGDMPGYDSVMLKTDLANTAGCCVVAGKYCLAA
jgi:ribonucleoside-triphosphate reductase